MKQNAPSLVSTQWLSDHLGHDDVRVLDASKHLPAAKRDPRAEFEAVHIPGALFLDLAGFKDTGSSVPDAIPNHAQFLARCSDLGVRRSDTIVLYDDSDVKTSARAWFTFRAHGFENVTILDGGLAKWRAEGRPLESGVPSLVPRAFNKADDTSPSGVRSKQDMLANLEIKAEQVLDARAADRVFGTGDDPVHGGQNGRIPGALNLPFGEVFEPDGTYKDAGSLRAAFEAAGVDWNRPVVTSCGSGVTASVLFFALHLAGKDDVALYDGSWAEWASDPDTPKAQGPE